MTCYETVAPATKNVARDRFGHHVHSADHSASENQSLGKIYTLGHDSKTYNDAIDTPGTTAPRAITRTLPFAPKSWLSEPGSSYQSVTGSKCQTEGRAVLIRNGSLRDLRVYSHLWNTTGPK